MAFKIKDVLIVDATVIIGLLILLTFQSISSTFIETEASDFMREWHLTTTQFDTIVEQLSDCELLDDDGFISAAAHTEYAESVGFVGSISEGLENKLKENCLELHVERITQEVYLAELSEWGYEFAYLEQYDDDDNLHNIYTHPFVHYDLPVETLHSVVESNYLHNIVSGPFYVNVANLIMIMPFVFSAAFASFNVLYARWKGQDEETNMASKWSVGLMGVGFIILFIGLIVILAGFYEVYYPFLEQGGEYTWKTSDCTNVAPEFITPDMNCEVLELEKELPFDETRDAPGEP